MSNGDPTTFATDVKNPRDPNAKIIGDYIIEKTLGQGTFGKVKQGIHMHTN
jgi:serine/threonine protein kinase